MDEWQTGARVKRECYGRGNDNSSVSGSDEAAAHTEPKVKAKNKKRCKRERKKETIAIRGDRTLDHTVKSRALYRLS